MPLAVVYVPHRRAELLTRFFSQILGFAETRGLKCRTLIRRQETAETLTAHLFRSVGLWAPVSLNSETTMWRNMVLCSYLM